MSDVIVDSRPELGEGPFTTTTEPAESAPLFSQVESLDAFETYAVCSAVLDATRIHLTQHGQQYCEGALCWAGIVVAERVAFITTAILFDAKGRWGVQISSAQTGALYEHCFTRGLTLFAQVHSHPARAYHSLVDTKLPHSAEPGFLSIVVPDFGRCSYADYSRWAIFQQVRYERWRQWGAVEKSCRLRVVDTIVRIP